MSSIIDFNFDDPPEVRRQAQINAEEGGPNSGFELQNIDFFKDGTAANTFPEMKDDIDLIVSTEAYVQRLIDLHERVSSARGMSRSFAVEFNELIPDMQAFSPNRFTEEITLTGWQPSLEALSAKIWALIIAGAVALIALIVKFFKWLFGGDSSSGGGGASAGVAEVRQEKAQAVESVRSKKDLSSAFSKLNAATVKEMKLLDLSKELIDDENVLNSELKNIQVAYPVAASFWKAKAPEDAADAVRLGIQSVIKNEKPPESGVIASFDISADKILFEGVSVSKIAPARPSPMAVAILIDVLKGGKLLKAVKSAMPVLAKDFGNLTDEELERAASLEGMEVEESVSREELIVLAGIFEQMPEPEDFDYQSYLDEIQSAMPTSRNYPDEDLAVLVTKMNRAYPLREAQQYEKVGPGLTKTITGAMYLLKCFEKIAEAAKTYDDENGPINALAGKMSKILSTSTRRMGGLTKLSGLLERYFNAWLELAEYCGKVTQFQYELYLKHCDAAGVKPDEEFESLYSSFIGKANSMSSSSPAGELFKKMKSSSSGIRTKVRIK